MVILSVVEHMTLTERQSSDLEGMVGRLLDGIPIVGKLRREKREEEEFQILFQETVGKVLQDIQVGGFVQEVWEDDFYQELYWVVLGGDAKRYNVFLGVDFEETSGVKGFSLNVKDLVVSGKCRRFHFGASTMDVSEKFFSVDWTGAYLLYMERVDKDEPWQEPERLNREEETSLLKELLIAGVDIEVTREDYNGTKKEEDPPDWLVFWVRDRREGHPLLSG